MDIIAQWIDNWLTPLWILFFVISVGYFIGKIKIKGISLDLSAILILSVFVGIFFDIFPQLSIKGKIVFQASEWTNSMKFLSSFGTALFLSVIGISSGYEIADTKRRNAFRHLGIGAIAVVSNFFLMKLIFLLDGTVEESLLYGVFCGAMTSSPGLAVLCEVSPEFAAQASSGYGSSYLFGVIGVVLFIQLATGRFSSSVPKQKSQVTVSEGSPALFGIIQISLTILIGIVLGALTFPATHISLGMSGGILLSGLLIGYFLRKKKANSTIPKSYCSLYRNFGLILFFVGNGIPSGMQMLKTFKPYVIVYGIILTLFPIILTYVFCRYGIKEDKRTTLNIICGSMTSTPAFGILSRCGRTSTDLSVYTCSYIGALVTMVVLLNFFV